MADRMISQAAKTCVVLHFLAWCAVAATWAAKWWKEGPAPAGPQYYTAEKFIGNLDILVYSNVHELAIKVGQTASAWFSADIGACLTIAFGGLILVAGTLQWFLLGKLVQWVALRRGRVLALVLLGFYGAWAAGAVILWLAS